MPPTSSFTYAYAQPDAYHFCQDSVLFPRLLAERLREREIAPGFRALDVCAGCGVIGLELAFHEPRLDAIDFMEIQDGFFRESFEANLKTTGRAPGGGFRFIAGSFLELQSAAYRETYDLIVGNPPYFVPGEGKLSPSQEQNRCRFFLDGDLSELFHGVALALKPGGEAYLLAKSGASHGRSLAREAQLWLAGVANVAEIGDVRGTSVIHVRR